MMTTQKILRGMLFFESQEKAKTRNNRLSGSETLELQRLPRWRNMNLLIFHIDLGARHACRGSRDRKHGRLDGRDQLEVPCVEFDYGFFGGDRDEETLAFQIAKDVGTKILFVHVEPKKGVKVNHGVTQLMKDIDRLDHKKLCLKSDGEPALVAIQGRGEETENRRSAVGKVACGR